MTQPGGVLPWDEFQTAFAGEFALDVSLVTADAALFDDLGFDSLAMIYLQALVEEYAGVVVGFDELPNLITVDDVYQTYLGFMLGTRSGQ